MEQNTHPGDNAFLKTVSDIILQNLDNEQFGVEQLSKKIGMSRSQLHRKLKLLRGSSVSQFIREVRLEEAKKFLARDEGSVAEIAWKVGFGSPSYFSKCFQKYYGYPPGETKNKPGSQTNNPAPAAVPKQTFKITDRQKLFVAITFVIAASLAAIFIFGKNDPAPPLEKSIAVLPFNNLSADQHNQHFADGLVEDLLSRLSVIKEIKVISRTSSDMYRVRGVKPLPRIASELGVTYIVEGSVQVYGEKARISVQLIDARQDVHLWAKNFDRDLDDIFEIQSEIAMNIAGELNNMLSEEQAAKVQKNQTTSFKAYELYHLGRYYWNMRSGEGYNKSIEYFEQALAHDSTYALAYAGLADTYNLMAIQHWMDPKEGRNKCVALALKALELDENLAEAYTVLGSIYDYADFDWDAAEKVFSKALEANPNYATLHHYYSEHLSITGRHELARQHINKALELDPLSFVIRYVSTKLYFHQGRFREALAENEKMKTFNPGHFWTFRYGLFIHHYLGQPEKAFEVVLEYYTKQWGVSRDSLTAIYKKGGMESIYRWIIDNGIPHSNSMLSGNYVIATYYAVLGENEKAIEWLQKSLINGDMNPEIGFDLHFRILRNHPDVIKILRQLDLPTAR